MNLLNLDYQKPVTCLLIIFCVGLYLTCNVGYAQPNQESDVVQKYEESIREWKDVCLKLRKLGFRFQTCEEYEVDSIRQEYKSLVEQGNQLFDQSLDLSCELIESGAGSPKTRGEVRRFVANLRNEYFTLGHYDKAYRLGMVLLDRENDSSQNLFELARIAGYCNEFEVSAELFRLVKARQELQLSPSVQIFLEKQPGYTAAWNAEKAKRAEETAQGNLPQVLFKTEKGDVKVELFENDAPNSVAHFLDLVESGVYETTLFFDGLKNGNLSGGSPYNDGTNNLEQMIASEHEKSSRGHYRGTLSLAPAGKNGRFVGSVFIFCRVANPELNGVFTPIGRVIEGQDVIDSIENSMAVNDEGEVVPVEGFKGNLLNSVEVIRPSTKSSKVIRQSPVDDLGDSDKDN